MFGFIKKAVKSVGGGLKAVVKSNLTKAVVGGAAFVFPPVGVPAAAGLAAATAGLKIADKAGAAVKTSKGVVKAMPMTPSVLGLAAASKVVGAVKSKDPKKRAAAVKVVKNTAALAKAGDRDAQRGLNLMVAAKRFSQWPKNTSRMKVGPFWLTKGGRISRAV